MNAHVFQHVPFEGLGSIAKWLSARQATVEWTRFYESAPVPDLRHTDLLIVLGGPMSANDESDLPWLQTEKQRIREAIDRGVPLIGVCLGAQLIASAVGCRVSANPAKEIGWFPIHSTPHGIALGFPPMCEVFHWHGETFALPPGAARLASTGICENQGFKLNATTIGLQFHLEATPESVREIAVHCAHELTDGPYVQSVAAMSAVAEHAHAITNRLMDHVLSQLVAGAGRSDASVSVGADRGLAAEG